MTGINLTIEHKYYDGTVSAPNLDACFCFTMNEVFNEYIISSSTPKFKRKDAIGKKEAIFFSTENV